MSGHSKWENIKRKKGKTDAIRARITTKISKEITIAARMGGGDPVGNMRLKLALTKAKQNNVPKENIQRAIAKGVGAASGAGFDEVTYEGYGPGGAAVIVECNTDNRNRAAADIRHAFTHHGGSVGTPGCVGWMFKKKGSIIVAKDAADEDTVMMIALDAGADYVGGAEYAMKSRPLRKTSSPSPKPSKKKASKRKLPNWLWFQTTMSSSKAMLLRPCSTSPMNWKNSMMYRKCTPTQNCRKMRNNGNAD